MAENLRNPSTISISSGTRSIKNLFKVKNMDIIVTLSLNLYSFVILTNYLCFQHDRRLFIPM